MKKNFLILVIAASLLAQCKKDINDKPAPDLSKGLMAFFQLNGQFNDSANVLDVDYGGLLSWAKNRYGYNQRALSCNGGLFYFTTPWWRADQITVSLWVKPNNLNIENYLLVLSEEAFGMYQKQSKIGFAISNPDSATALADIAMEWTHVAGTFDGNDIKTYINGKLANTVRHPGVPDVTSAITVGTYGIGEWKGVVDEIRFYNRALSAEEIKQLYALN